MIMFFFLILYMMNKKGHSFFFITIGIKINICMHVDLVLFPGKSLIFQKKLGLPLSHMSEIVSNWRTPSYLFKTPSLQIAKFNSDFLENSNAFALILGILVCFICILMLGL